MAASRFLGICISCDSGTIANSPRYKSVYPRRSENPGPSARVNGGWCRPASEFGLDGSSYDGATFPGPCAINCTNGEDIGTAAFPYPIYGSNGTSETFAFHPAGANILFGDASVHFLAEDIEIRTYAKMVTRKGHEVISEVLK
jgi:prepilin-type processing-associated H-X9-DG protein